MLAGLTDITRRKLTQLFEPHDMPVLFDGLNKSIAFSFTYKPMNNVTKAEVKRRFDICMDWAFTLRGDLGWSTQRIKDSFVPILKCELEGVRWEPSSSTFWLPGDEL